MRTHAEQFNLDTLPAKERRILARHLAKWERRLRPYADSIRESQRITAEDLAVTITEIPHADPR